MLKKLSVCLMAISLVACATTKEYEICDTPNCGDPVDVVVE